MDGQTAILIFSTGVLIFSMWYAYKLSKKDQHKK